MTEQSAEERAREALPEAWTRTDGGPVVVDPIAAITAANLTVIDSDELAQLRAEHEALAAFADGVQKYAPKPVTGCCDDDGACYPPENCRGFREWQEWVVNCAAVEPILARRREAAE